MSPTSRKSCLSFTFLKCTIHKLVISWWNKLHEKRHFLEFILWKEHSSALDWHVIHLPIKMWWKSSMVLMLLLGFLLLGINDLVNFLCVSTVPLALEVNDIGLYFLHLFLKALDISYSIPHYGSFVHLAMWMWNASKTEKKIRPRCRKSHDSVLHEQNVGIIDPT